LKPDRFATLDYLRGLMALAVLVFHYDKWLTGAWDAVTLQGRLGVYAVSTFFVLSGLTLTLVYENKLDHQFRTWGLFFRKRIFRIFPLLWLATLATLVLDGFSRPYPVIFLNLSGLFGFLNPVKDIATGAWSIGCELVFYLAFPTLLLISKRSKTGFLALFGIILGFGFWVAFYWFSPENSLQTAWWEAYVQAANHAFFFVGGMGIGVFRKDLQGISRLFWLCLTVFAALLFTWWPTTSEPFQLVYGWNRVLFSILTLTAVAACFNSKIVLKGHFHQMLTWLGAVSYSLYLLHPLVFRVLSSIFGRCGLPEGYWQLFVPSIIATLVLCHFSYFFLEKPLAQKG